MMYFENDRDQLIGNTNEYQRNYNKWQVSQRLEEAGVKAARSTKPVEPPKNERIARLRNGAKLQEEAYKKRFTLS